MDAKSGETKQEHSSPSSDSERLTDLIASVLQLSSATAMLAQAMLRQAETTQDLVAIAIDDEDEDPVKAPLGNARGGRVS